MIKSLVLVLSLFGFMAAAQPSNEAPATGGDSAKQASPNREPAKKKSKKKGKKKGAKKSNSAG